MSKTIVEIEDEICPDCAGEGYYEREETDGGLVTLVPCSTCDGTGIFPTQTTENQ